MDSKTIVEWADQFGILYSEPDKGRTPEEIWLGAMKHCTDMGENIRRVAYDDLMKSAAHAFCWLLSFVTKCKSSDVAKKDVLFHIDHSFNEIVFLKYPHKCGHCIKAPCQCNVKDIDEKKNKAAKYGELYRRCKKENLTKYDIGKWLDIFQDIYQPQISLQQLDDIGFHFLEEVGEAATTVCQLAQMRGVPNSNIRGLDEEFFSKLGTIEGIVSEYVNFRSVDDDGKPKFDYALNKPNDIKGRLICAKMGLIIEIADTFSWFCSVLIKIRDIIGKSLRDEWVSKTRGSLEEKTRIKEAIVKIKSRFDLEERLYEVYTCLPSTNPNCPSCNKPKCRCVFYPRNGRPRGKERSRR